MNEFPEFDASIADEFGYSEAGTLDFLGVPVYDADAIIHLLMRFGFHMLICFIILHFCYYRISRNAAYYKSLIYFSAGMFLLLFLLESVKLQIGLTLGLFAIFGVIRYRTETVPIKEMTYLFMIIAISVINGLSLNISYLELAIANLLIAGIMFFFEYQKFMRINNCKLILYERIELIVPEKHDALMEDLKKRTGLNIVKVEVGHIDFLRDVAFLKIYYPAENGHECTTLNTMTKLRPES